jgi:hypothetical protein
MKILRIFSRLKESMSYVLRASEVELKNIVLEKKSLVVVNGVEKNLNLKVPKGEAEVHKRFQQLIKVNIMIEVIKQST